MKRDLSFLLYEIIGTIEKIENYTQGMGEEKFLKDEKTQDAVMKKLEVIGEAIKSLPSEFKARCSEIEWKKIVGMRDILIHAYFRVNARGVWSVVENELPELKQKIMLALEKVK